MSSRLSGAVGNARDTRGEPIGQLGHATVASTVGGLSWCLPSSISLIESGYMVVACGPENKKPSRNDWAKSLISLVGRDGFELSTYGLRVCWHFATNQCITRFRAPQIPLSAGRLKPAACGLSAVCGAIPLLVAGTGMSVRAILPPKETILGRERG